MADEETYERLAKLEAKCAKIPDICESLNRIEYELIGTKFGNRPSYRSRIEDLEGDRQIIVDRLQTVEEKQKNTIRASAGGAGGVTVLINFLKEIFLG